MMPFEKSKLKPRPKLPAPQPTNEWSFEAIGTSWWIGIYEPLGTHSLNALKKKVAARIEVFDQTYSRFRADSIVTTIAKKAGKYQLPADSQALFALYRQLYDCSNGLVTPLIGQVLSDAGYDAAYTLRPGSLHTPPDWDAAMTYTDGVLTTTQPLLLDVGAAGKGYLVDIVAALLQEHGVTRFCVDASGDMLCRGLDAPLHIGLEHPDDSAQIVGVAFVQDGALCGSAGNRRTWNKYHHIMNPKSLASPKDIKAVWVTAESGLLADGLATALFFVTPQVLQKLFVFEYAIVFVGNKLEHSRGFLAELFTSENIHA